MNLGLLLVIGIVVIAFYAIGVYNTLVTLKNQIKAAIQEIGNQLKRQAELIPNLEVSAKGYLTHEKNLYKMITEARKTVESAVNSGNLDKLSNASSAVANLLPKLQVVVESNPEMKGADVITKLMDELRDTSDKVMYSRRSLIDLVADYNIKLQTFPTNLVANMFSFKPEAGLSTPVSGEHLSVSEAETKPVKIKL